MPVFLRLSRTLTLGICLWFCSISLSQPILQDHETLLDVHRGQSVSMDEFLQVLRAADVSVWGEIHDNPRHHTVRAEWLRLMEKTGRSVVAEHLTAPQLFDTQQELLTGLQMAGFDAQGWQWPMHQVLFATATSLELPLWGGNLSKEESQSIFKTKGDATPSTLKHLLQRAVLNQSEKHELTREIDEGHCGALPADMFDGMLAVQRARDASMAHMAMQHLPAVVLAGNGHAWKHLGIPQIIRSNRPDLKVVSVLMLEHEPFENEAQRLAWLNRWTGQTDYIWAGPPVSRADPCKAFSTSK